MTDFVANIARFVKKANGNVDLVVKKITFDVFSRVIRKTPVDTGRARGNWLCSTDNPLTVQLSGARSAEATISDMGAIALRQPAGGVVYLTNNLPYIHRLENGWSQQAPAGMVGTTLTELPYIVQVQAREVAK
jgi:hypothetical protein